MTSTRARVAVLAVAVAMLTAACGDRPDPLDLGFKRVSLDLVFKDAEKATPEQAQRVTRVIEYYEADFGVQYEELEEEEAPRRRIPRVPRNETKLPPCLKADENAAPLIPALSALHDPPRVGSYRRQNTGTIRLVVPPLLDATLPYPFLTTWTLTNLETDVGTVATNPKDDENLPVDNVPRVNPEPRVDVVAAPTVTRFTITRSVTDDIRTVDTYQYYGDRGTLDADSTEYDGNGLYLVKREWISNRTGHQVFEPTPPVMVTAIGDEHETQEVKVSSGVDRERNMAMTIQSKIVGREDIDVCGEVVGTYRVEFDEVMVDLSKGQPQSSLTPETGKKSIWNITFNRGLTIVREEIHRVDRRNVESVPATITWDYVSTAMNMEPEPIEEKK